MKIAIWHNLPSGGGKRALYAHVRGLLEQGHTLEAWCPPTANQQYLPLSKLIREHILPLHAPPKPRITAHVNGIEQRLVAMEQHCQACAEQINRAGFDLVFVHPCQEFRSSPIGRFVQIPSVLFLQEPFRWLYEALPELPWRMPERGTQSALAWIRRRIKDMLSVRQLRIQAAAEYRNATFYRRILANSYFSRESILRAYGLDAQLCYLGIDTDLFIDQQRERENLVLGVGAFTFEKNIHFVIDALGRVSDPRPHLVWIGNVANASYLSWLKQLAQERHVDFTALHMIPDEELVAWLNRAYALVYAPRLEPMGLAPIEANACGTPAIGVAEGGVRESILHEQTGLLVDARPEAMAAAMQRLRDRPDYAHTLGQQGKQRAQTFWSIEAATQRLEAHLREVVQI